MSGLKDRLDETVSIDTTRAGLRAIGTGALSMVATVMLTVPVSAQLGSASEATNVEGVGVLEGIVYFLMGVVPIAATAVLLGSFLALMFIRDPQTVTTVKGFRNRAITYGYVVVPCLGLILAGIGTITGNPVLEGMSF